MSRGVLLAQLGQPAIVVLAAALGAACAGGSPPGQPGPAGAGAGAVAIRINQLGHRPVGRKVAVVCATEEVRVTTFDVVDRAGRRVLGPERAQPAGAFGPCVATYRLDFSAVTAEGRYVVRAGGVASPEVRIGADVYRGAADTLLAYLRQQRSLFNPLFRDSVHEETDAILVDHPRAGEFLPVAGGWADAADYLQYVTTSATATFHLLMAYRDHPGAFGDASGADGLPGSNGVADVLDEARWGLEWLSRMHPEPTLMLNQIADDRDHRFPDLPTTDSSDYGWGRGGYRPVYACTGVPQGLFDNRNRSTGVASTAGKFAAAFALGSLTFGDRDPVFSARLAEQARTAYGLGRADPGVCQTAPGRSPYFYEEENWVDDMELAAAGMHALTGDASYLRSALDYAAREPVTPWMGADTARHYEWYPWHNAGHHEIWRAGDESSKRLMVDYYRRGLEAVAARAGNGFRVGIPFIWCSNDLMVSFATQALLYRTMTGDTSFVELEEAAVDWLFGVNPWGTSMVIGLPAGGEFPTDPHSVIAHQLGWETQRGGLVDGPVYRSIFENLLGIRLLEPDEFARWNVGFIVYHDDYGDYSTNEAIMDGSANLVYLVAARSP